MRAVDERGHGRRVEVGGRGPRVDAFEEEGLRGVEGADAGEVALVEQGGADRHRAGVQPAGGLTGVPVGAEDVGAEVADQAGLVGRSRRRAGRRGAGRRRSRPGWRPRRGSAGWRGCGRSGGRSRRPATGPPSAGGSGWSRRCRVAGGCSSPRLTTSSVVTPRKSSVDSSGQRRSVVVNGSPASAWFRRAAVRKTVSPSGTGRRSTVATVGRPRRSRSPRGVAWNPARDSASATGCPQPRTWLPSVRSTVSRPRAPSRTAAPARRPPAAARRSTRSR